MAKATLKTTITPVTVGSFIEAVADARRREEAHALDALHRKVTGNEPRMWGPSIVGYGSYRYRYESGREGEMCRAGFSPRKAALTVYLMGDYCDHTAEAEALLAKLGPHSLGKSCLYIKRLDRIDLAVLEELVRLSWDSMNRVWPDQAP